MVPSANTSVNKIVATLHNVIQANLPTSIGIGIIISPPPEIKIAYNNIILDKNDLYIDAFLLKNYARNIKGSEKISKAEGNIKTITDSKRRGGGDYAFHTHAHKVNSSYKANLEGEYQASAVYTDCGLAKGDKVSLLPVADGQKFIVLGKIIPMWELNGNDDNGKSIDTSTIIN